MSAPTTSAGQRSRNSAARELGALSRTDHTLFLCIIMAPLKKPAGQIVQAEIALQQSLKNCLVNLPSSLVSVLVNANTV